MHRAVGYGSTSQRGTGSEEAKNLNYEGTTASGARSGRTGATSQLDSGAGAGTGTGYGTGTGSGTGTGTGTRTGMTGTGTGTGGTTGTSGISEGFRGMNLTHQSGVRACLVSLTVISSIIQSSAVQSIVVLASQLLTCVHVCSMKPTIQLLATAPLCVTPSTTQR